MFQYMIDIETLGTKTTAPILSIGAVRFTHDMTWNYQTFERFSVNVDLETSTLGGGVIEPSTLKWWLAPERAAAREELLKGHGVDLRDALDGLKDWMGEGGPTWANSPTFDLAILARAMNAFSIDVPWKFFQERDHRTIMAIINHAARDSAAHRIREVFPSLVGHSAVDDAEFQVRMLLWFNSFSINLGH